MKVGDYVRTIDGYIAKITEITEEKEDINGNKYRRVEVDTLGIYLFDDNLDEFNSNSRIIELVQVGDYVNGIKINSVYDDDKEANDYNLKHEKCLGTNVYDEDYQEKLIYEEDIKSIVTHEQFSQMEYRIGE